MMRRLVGQIKTPSISRNTISINTVNRSNNRIINRINNIGYPFIQQKKNSLSTVGSMAPSLQLPTTISTTASSSSGSALVINNPTTGITRSNLNLAFVNTRRHYQQYPIHTIQQSIQSISNYSPDRNHQFHTMESGMGSGMGFISHHNNNSPTTRGGIPIPSFTTTSLRFHSTHSSSSSLDQDHHDLNDRDTDLHLHSSSPTPSIHSSSISSTTTSSSKSLFQSCGKSTQSSNYSKNSHSFSTSTTTNNNNNDDDNNNNNTSSTSSTLSSTRGTNAVQLLPTYLTDARAVTQYHPTDSPNGALQLSVAENQMLEDLLVPAIQRFSTKTTTRTTSTTMDSKSNEETCGLFHSNQIYYQPTHGRPGLRTAMSNYLQTILYLNDATTSTTTTNTSNTATTNTTTNAATRTLDEEGLILGAGCNAVLENLCFCLAEQGDGVLLPTPYYAAFEFDLVARAGLKILPVNTIQHNNDLNSTATTSTTTPNYNNPNEPIPASAYYPTKHSLTQTYNTALQSGTRPKILLLSHPNNPLGICYPPHVIQTCIDWCREFKIHLVSDEIYAGSVYKDLNNDGGERVFHSTLALAANHDNDTKKGLGLGPYIHFVYALSKDFALSGLRVGAAYSENKEIRLPMQKLNDLCQISSQTQLLVERMLSAKTSTITTASSSSSSTNDGEEEGSGFGSHDDLWCTKEFLPMNHERIRSRCDQLQQCLDEVGIPYLKADSGLFLWMDLRSFLPPLQEEEEGLQQLQQQKESNESMDQRERTLYLELMSQHGLLFTPGRSMRTEYPGFFRCVFTAASDQEFDIGLERIRMFVKAKTEM